MAARGHPHFFWLHPQNLWDDFGLQRKLSELGIQGDFDCFVRFETECLFHCQLSFVLHALTLHWIAWPSALTSSAVSLGALRSVFAIAFIGLYLCFIARTHH